MHKLKALGYCCRCNKTIILYDRTTGTHCFDFLKNHVFTKYKSDIESVDIATINNRTLIKKVVDSGECVIPIEIFEHKPENIKTIIEILKVVQERHLFIDKEPLADTVFATQALLDIFSDTVEHVNHCIIKESVEVSEKLKELKEAKINNIAILSNLLIEIAGLTQRNFKYKVNNGNGSKVPLSKDDLFVFYKIRDSLLKKAYELQFKIPVKESYYQDVLLYKLKALEESIATERNQASAWQSFMMRCGGRQEGNNFARTVKTYINDIILFKEQLPILHEYIKKKNWNG